MLHQEGDAGAAYCKGSFGLCSHTQAGTGPGGAGSLVSSSMHGLIRFNN